MKFINRFTIGYFIAFLMFLFLFSSCEKDDICLEPATPKLILRFYNHTQHDTLKTVEHFSLTALPENQKIISDKNTDSIGIALNVNADSCKFIFQQENNPDTIMFYYQREFIFISKSCGYKCIFHQLQAIPINDGDNWIKNTEIINSEITIDTVAHVKLYH
jgi:hypothetical protein